MVQKLEPVLRLVVAEELEVEAVVQKLEPVLRLVVVGSFCNRVVQNGMQAQRKEVTSFNSLSTVISNNEEYCMGTATLL